MVHHFLFLFLCPLYFLHSISISSYLYTHVQKSINTHTHTNTHIPIQENSAYFTCFSQLGFNFSSEHEPESFGQKPKSLLFCFNLEPEWDPPRSHIQTTPPPLFLFSLPPTHKILIHYQETPEFIYTDQNYCL